MIKDALEIEYLSFDEKSTSVSLKDVIVVEADENQLKIRPIFSNAESIHPQDAIRVSFW